MPGRRIDKLLLMTYYHTLQLSILGEIETCNWRINCCKFVNSVQHVIHNMDTQSCMVAWCMIIA